MANATEEVTAVIKRFGMACVLWEVMEYANRLNTQQEPYLTRLSDGLRNVVMEYDCRYDGGHDDDARVDGVPVAGD